MPSSGRGGRRDVQPRQTAVDDEPHQLGHREHQPRNRRADRPHQRRFAARRIRGINQIHQAVVLRRCTHSVTPKIRRVRRVRAGICAATSAVAAMIGSSTSKLSPAADDRRAARRKHVAQPVGPGAVRQGDQDAVERGDGVDGRLVGAAAGPPDMADDRRLGACRPGAAQHPRIRQRPVEPAHGVDHRRQLPPHTRHEQGEHHDTDPCDRPDDDRGRPNHCSPRHVNDRNRP